MHLADHLQDLRILADQRSVAVAVDALALGHQPRHVDARRPADTGKRGQMHQLEEAAGILEAAAGRVDQFRIDDDIGKPRGTAGGQRTDQSRPSRRGPRRPRHWRGHQRADRLVVLVGGPEVDPVGVERAGSVVFLAAELPVVALAHQPRRNTPTLLSPTSEKPLPIVSRLAIRCSHFARHSAEAETSTSSVKPKCERRALVTLGSAADSSIRRLKNSGRVTPRPPASTGTRSVENPAPLSQAISSCGSRRLSSRSTTVARMRAKMGRNFSASSS